VEDEGGVVGCGDKSSPDTSSSFDYFQPSRTSGTASANHHSGINTQLNSSRFANLLKL
jgi:hypothetical protein